MAYSIPLHTDCLYSPRLCPFSVHVILVKFFNFSVTQFPRRVVMMIHGAHKSTGRFTVLGMYTGVCDGFLLWSWWWWWWWWWWVAGPESQRRSLSCYWTHLGLGHSGSRLTVAHTKKLFYHNNPLFCKAAGQRTVVVRCLIHLGYTHTHTHARNKIGRASCRERV